MLCQVGIVLACIYLQVCGELQGFSGPRIVGGQPVENRRDFPYQASVRYYDNHICGGTILDSEHIITASHCCFDDDHVILNAKHITVVVGDLNLFQSTSYTLVRKVKYVFTHNQYSFETISNDIAIMRIHGTFEPWNENVYPVNLSTISPAPSPSWCLVSGWGVLHQEDHKPTPNLYFARVPVLDDKTCRSSYKPRGIKPGMFCAGFTTGNVDACQGDSGGPLVCDQKLTGIVSWGLGCALPGKPGVYTDVSMYRGWVDEQLLRSSALKVFSSSVIIATIVALHFLYLH